MKRIDHYTVLQVPRTASAKEIKLKYYELSKQHHPDRNNNSKDSQEKFVQLSEAYSTLSDLHKRRDYDRNLAFDESAAPGPNSSRPSQTAYHSRTTYRQRSQINPDDWILFRHKDPSRNRSAYYYNHTAHQQGHYGQETEWQRKRDEWRARMHGKFKNFEMSEQEKRVRKRMIVRLMALMVFFMVLPEITTM